MITVSNSQEAVIMAAYQDVFRRYEKKYMLDSKQYEALRRMLEPFMEADSYGQHTICNLYYDTESFELIRTSLDKPMYKEKLRLRSYGIPRAQDAVYLEIKKKYEGVVYKRRVRMTLTEAYRYLNAGIRPAKDSQILREIDWFLQHNAVKPRAFIAYDRTALFGREEEALRITFDRNIRWRDDTLDLSAGDAGERLIGRDQILMEIKIPDAMPFWLAGTLSLLGIYPLSFSKYGTCYREHLQQDTMIKQGGIYCA